MSELFCQLGLDPPPPPPPPSADNSRIIDRLYVISLMLVNKVIFLPENDLLIKSVISIHRRFKFYTNIQRPNCLYPPTPDRRAIEKVLNNLRTPSETGDLDPPHTPPVEKIQKYRVPKAILVRIP